MKLDMHAISRKNLYNAVAQYNDGKVVVLKGSRINIAFSSNYQPPNYAKRVLDDKSVVGDDGVLLKNVTFKTLSSAATFVTGSIANGMLTWKTKDGKPVRLTINPDWKPKKK